MIRKSLFVLFALGTLLSSCKKEEVNPDQNPQEQDGGEDGTVGKFSGYWGGSLKKTNSDTEKDIYVFVEQYGDSISGYVTNATYAFQNKKIEGRVVGNTLTFEAEDVVFTGNIEGSAITGTFDYYNGITTGVWNTTLMTGERLFNYKILTPIDTIQIAVGLTYSLTTDGENFYVENDNNVIKISKEGVILDTIAIPEDYPTSLGWDDGKLIVGTNNYVGSSYNHEQFYFLDPDNTGFAKYVIPDNDDDNVGFVIHKNNYWILTEAYLYELNSSGEIIQTLAYNEYSTFNTRNGLASDGTNLYFTEEYTSNYYKWYIVDENLQITESPTISGYYVEDVTFDGTNLIVLDTKAQQIRVVDISDFSLISSTPLTLSEMDEITWDGTNIWVSGRKDNDFKKLHKISDEGSILESVDYPGFNLLGLDFIDGYFYAAQWDFIHRMSHNERYVEKVLASDNFSLHSKTTYNSNEIWSYDNDAHTIQGYSFSERSHMQFNYEGCDPTWGCNMDGLAVDNNNIWITQVWLNYLSFIRKYDKSGALVETYYPEWPIVGSSSMVSDGTHIWYIGSNPAKEGTFIYKIKIVQ
jgi:hypothetical protein